MKFNSRYGLHPHVPTPFLGPEMTKQSFKEQADINNIMSKYKRTGVIPQFQGANYMDAPDGLDYHQAMNMVADADHNFALLPAELRARFNNAPGQLLDFLGQPENKAEAIALGLVNAEPEMPSAAPSAPVATPTAGDPPKAS